MTCVTVLYPNDTGARFDFGYYQKNHIPLVRRLYGAAIAKVDVLRGVASQDGSAPRYVCTCHIHVADQKAFEAAAAKHQAEVVADIAKFTNVMPAIQIDEVM